MDDYFAELGMERRAWLELDEIKARFHALSAERHPDAGGSAAAFALLNEAARVLSDPSLRIKHLLALNGHTVERGTELDAEMQTLFMEVGGVLQAARKWRERESAALSPLAKALLAGEKRTVAEKTRAPTARVQQCEERLLDLLRNENRMDELASLAERLAFCAKWLRQLREMSFALQSGA